MSSLLFATRERPALFEALFESAGLFIRVKKRILLLKRHPEKPYGETWALPAGKLERGELPKEAALREVEEETGLILLEEKVEEMAPLFVKLEGYAFIFHLFFLELPEEPTLSLDLSAHTTYRWVTPEEARELPLIPGGEESFRELERHLEEGAGDPL